jgi:hypothetical protein
MAVGMAGDRRLADDAEAALATETDEGVARLLTAAAQLSRKGRL